MTLTYRILLGSLLTTAAATLVFSLSVPSIPWWVWYLLSVNLVALGVYGYDKLISSSDRIRVPELALQSLVLLGGTIGALVGIFGFRHKTRKVWFLFGVLALLILQLLTMAWVLGIFTYTPQS
jgi:uncharacterized membrane protein YsdA (DUF1294 family)